MELSNKTVGAILERWWQDGTITDHCAEYGEPGYSTPDGSTPVVVLGNYWCQCGTPEGLHDYATHHPRLWQQLEDQGVCFEWHDEWAIDREGDKAYRSSPNSYAWQPSFVYTEDGEILTPDDDVEAWIEWATSNPNRCIPSNVWSTGDLINAGFQQHNGTYETGWHPGQTDTPDAVTAAVRAERGDDVDIVFMLDSTGQFDVAFSAWWRYSPDEGDCRQCGDYVTRGTDGMWRGADGTIGERHDPRHVHEPAR